MGDRYRDEYPTCAQTYATVRVFHPQLDLNRVTAALHIQPSEAWLPGAIRFGAQRKQGGWLLSSDGNVDSRDLRRHLDWVLDKLMLRVEEVENLMLDGHAIDVSCYWASASGHGGPALDPDQMGKLAALRLPIWFDVYFPGKSRA